VLIVRCREGDSIRFNRLTIVKVKQIKTTEVKFETILPNKKREKCKGQRDEVVTFAGYIKIRLLEVDLASVKLLVESPANIVIRQFVLEKTNGRN